MRSSYWLPVTAGSALASARCSTSCDSRMARRSASRGPDQLRLLGSVSRSVPFRPCWRISSPACSRDASAATSAGTRRRIGPGARQLRAPGRARLQRHGRTDPGQLPHGGPSSLTGWVACLLQIPIELWCQATRPADPGRRYPRCQARFRDRHRRRVHRLPGNDHHGGEATEVADPALDRNVRRASWARRFSPQWSAGSAGWGQPLAARQYPTLDSSGARWCWLYAAEGRTASPWPDPRSASTAREAVQAVYVDLDAP